MFGNLTEAEANILAALIGAGVVIIIALLTGWSKSKRMTQSETRELRRQVHEKTDEVRNTKIWDAIKNVTINNDRITANLQLLTTSTEQLHKSIRDISNSLDKKQDLLERNQAIQEEKWKALKSELIKQEQDTNRQLKQILDITSQQGQQITALIRLCGTKALKEKEEVI